MYRNMHPSRIRQVLQGLLAKDELTQEDLKTMVQLNLALVDRLERTERDVETARSRRF